MDEELESRIRALERKFVRKEEEKMAEDRDMEFQLSSLDVKNFKGGKIENDVIIPGARMATVIVGIDGGANHKFRADYIVPDGATNAQVTINAAIDSLPAGGGKVLLLEGTYIIDAPILLPAYVTFEGQGRSAIIKVKDGLNGTDPMVRNANVTGDANITIKSLVIDGNSANNLLADQSGIYLMSATFSTVIEVLIMNIRTSLTKGCLCLIGGSDNTVSSCTCQASASNGIALEESSNNTITGNVCHGNQGYSIYLTNSSNNSITGNVCRGSTIYGGIGIISSLNNTISGNTCQGNDSYGIYLYESNNNTVTGNTCQGNGIHGIHLRISSNNTVAGNACHKNSQGSTTNNNIDIITGSNYNNIQSNSCRIADQLRSNTATAGTVNTITLDAGASATDDTYNNKRIRIVAGTGSGQNRLIGDYVGATKVATVSTNWNTNPDATSVFIIYNTTNLPRYGIRINDASCVGNLATNNDLYDSGANADLSDSGTGTITIAGNRIS